MFKCELANHKNIHVKASAFHALRAKRYPYSDLAPFIERVVKVYTPERVIGATDCPINCKTATPLAARLSSCVTIYRFSTRG